MKRRIPSFGILYYEKKGLKRELPKDYTDEEYIKYQHSRYGNTIYDTENIIKTKNMVDKVEGDPAFDKWFKESADIIEQITGYVPTKISDIE